MRSIIRTMLYRRSFFAALLVGGLVITVLSFGVFFYRSGPNQAVDYSRAIPATPTFAKKVIGFVSVMDSHTETRTTHSYQLHLLVDKQADFVPLALQLINPDSGSVLSTPPLSLAQEFSCFRLPDKPLSDPYSRYLAQQVLAYETPFLQGRDVDRFAHNTSRTLNLVLQAGPDLLIVDGLKINAQCLWLTE